MNFNLIFLTKVKCFIKSLSPYFTVFINTIFKVNCFMVLSKTKFLKDAFCIILTNLLPAASKIQIGEKAKSRFISITSGYEFQHWMVLTNRTIPSSGRAISKGYRGLFFVFPSFLAVVSENITGNQRISEA